MVRGGPRLLRVHCIYKRARLCARCGFSSRPRRASRACRPRAGVYSAPEGLPLYQYAPTPGARSRAILQRLCALKRCPSLPSISKDVGGVWCRCYAPRLCPAFIACNSNDIIMIEEFQSGPPPAKRACFQVHFIKAACDIIHNGYIFYFHLYPLFLFVAVCLRF